MREHIFMVFKNNDILIPDRGFCDSIYFFNKVRVSIQFPAFLGANQKQFCTKDCNMSRLVIKIRWAVKSVNARLKTWAFLGQVIYVTEYPPPQGIAVICNCFRLPLQQSREVDCDIALNMVECSKMPKLHGYIKDVRSCYQTY